MSFDVSEIYDRLYRFCYFRVRDRELSQDTVQEAFTRYIGRYGPVNEKALPVLYTIARNLCIDSVRRLPERTEYDDFLPDERQAAGNQTEDLVEKIGVQRALSRMPGDEAVLLLLVLADGFSIQDAGRILGLSRFAVYRRLQAGKKRLREELAREGLVKRPAGKTDEKGGT